MSPVHVLTDLQRRTLGLLKRSDMWSEIGRYGGFVSASGRRGDDVIQELFDEQTLKELLLLGFVSCDAQQRLHAEYDPGFGRQAKAVEMTIKYWKLTAAGYDA